MSYRTQKGSMHAVVIICLVVALCCALGIAFYQNFIMKEKDRIGQSQSSRTELASPSKKESPKKEVKLLDGSIDSNFNTKLTFKYPETWKITSERTSGESGQKITVTSPSGKYTVMYEVFAGGGIGCACMPEETGTIVSSKYQVAPGFSNMSYIEVTYRGAPSVDGKPGAVGHAFLADSQSVAGVASGDSMCELYLRGVRELGGDKYTYLIDASMKISSASTADEFKAALAGEEYEQGKVILLSTVH